MHPSDDELIQLIDGESPAHSAAELSMHLQQCWRCRARRAELENAITAFVGLHRATLDGRVPAGEGPAALLKARMDATKKPPLRRVPTVLWMPLAGSAVAILIAVLWIAGPNASAGALPDSRLTPGATRLISKEQVCAVPAMDDDRPISVELATRVFQEYRIQPIPKTYEVDYLITPGLGGADDIRNLWPQPYESGMWTARVKDALEDHLRTLVCEGSVDLATAQHEIATDWIAAYRKYFRTNRPIPAHTLFVKDRPWE